MIRVSRGGLVPLTSDELIGAYELMSAFHITPFEELWINSNVILVIADKYLHINLEKAEKVLKRKLEYSRAYKDRDGKMRYEFKIKELGIL